MMNIFIFIFVTIPVVSAVAIAVHHILKGIPGDAQINKEELKKGIKLAIGSIIYAGICLIIISQFIKR